MLKFKVELDLGNESMRTVEEVQDALVRSLKNFTAMLDGGTVYFSTADSGVVYDTNGNRVGVWGVDHEKGGT